MFGMVGGKEGRGYLVIVFSFIGARLPLTLKDRAK